MLSLRRGLVWWTLAWPAALRAEGPAPASASDPTVSAPTSEAPASADAAREASARIAEGIELRKQGDDRRALAAFERAWELGQSPQALAQRALAEQALGRWLDADQHLTAALEHAGDPWIVEHRATLDGALHEIGSRLGSLEVTCNVPGAEIRLDGRVLGRTPLARPLRVVAGQSVMQISARGYLDITRHVQVDALGLARMDVTLIPTPTPDAGPSSSKGAGRQGPRTVDSLAAPVTPGAPPRDVLLYTSLGLSALGLAVGATGYWMREVNVRLYNDDARCDVRLGIRRSEECPDEAAAWRRGEALAIAGAAAAGVFGGTALYLWLARPEPDARQGVACGFRPSALACHGVF